MNIKYNAKLEVVVEMESAVFSQIKVRELSQMAHHNGFEFNQARLKVVEKVLPIDTPAPPEGTRTLCCGFVRLPDIIPNAWVMVAQIFEVNHAVLQLGQAAKSSI